MFSSIKETLAYIKNNDIRQLDLKVVDLQGRWRHMTYSAPHVTEKLFKDGTGISLSPYAGYRTIEQGDMKVIPDVTTAFVDPFHEVATLSFICNMHMNDGTRYNRDPRFILHKAEEHLRSVQPGARALFMPEMEFYLFDKASFGTSERGAHYSVDAAAVGWSDDKSAIYHVGFEKIGQADQPLDRHVKVREDMVARIEEAGVKVKYHHHELGTPGQVEIEVLFDSPMRSADAIMVMKYLIKNTALRHGQVATFMPKPLIGHAGNGLHFHQYLATGDRSLFYDEHGYGCMSPMAIHYLAGLLHHTPALMGLGNASTNSYRRFAPNMAAPVKRFFSLSNRSSTVRIPGYALNAHEARVEYRMPDATANPYLIIAAQLMAGLDGITARMDPSALGYGPFDVNVYAQSQAEQDKLHGIPMEFAAALGELDRGRGFLTTAGVFDDETVDAWLQVKRNLELAPVHVRPHPYEYVLYFDL